MVSGHWPAARAARFLLSLCAALALLASGAASANAAQVEAPSWGLQVWNLNTHQMQTGGAGETTDYRQFLDYITDPTRVAYYPDVLTLQEVGTQVNGKDLAHCTAIEAYLEWRTPLNYYCVENGQGGGPAIVYNTNRLSRQSDTGGNVHVYKIRQVNAPDGSYHAGDCDLEGSSWWTKTLRLKDDVNTTKYTNVEAVHLPTDNYPADDLTGWATDCAWNNMKLTSPGVTNLGSASMQIMAGDWNHSDAYATDNYLTFQDWGCWFEAVNTPDMGGCLGDAWGWKDAMYRYCVTTTTAVYSCLRANFWTVGSGARIDFLFAKAYAVHNQVTVPWNLAYQAAVDKNGPQQYSDHRGQGALVKYY